MNKKIFVKTNDNPTQFLPAIGSYPNNAPTNVIEGLTSEEIDERIDTAIATAPVVDSRPYKVYTAKVFQSGTNTPSATVLENTFTQEVTFSRLAVGDYRVSCDEFPATVQYATFISATTPRTISAVLTQVYCEYNEFAQQVVIDVRNTTNFQYVDGLAGIIEIRVYN